MEKGEKGRKKEGEGRKKEGEGFCRGAKQSLNSIFPSMCVDSLCRKEGKGSCLRRQTLFFPVIALTPYWYVKKEGEGSCLRRKIVFNQAYDPGIRDPGSGIPDPTGSIVTDVQTDNNSIFQKKGSGIRDPSLIPLVLL